MWLPYAKKIDLSNIRGNGPFTAFLGFILHVNESENGTDDSFWSANANVNPDEVCPTFQVRKDGSYSQMLPLDWQPSCQRDGNFRYGAVETAGLNTEPLTDAQVNTIAVIAKAYHDVLGMPYLLASVPGQPGIGTHGMGGTSWGGHPYCPGLIRMSQRLLILKRAQSIGKGTTLMASDIDSINTRLDTLTDLVHNMINGRKESDNKDVPGDQHIPGLVQLGAMITALQTDVTALKGS